MDKAAINAKLQELEDQIKNSYNNASILNYVCTLKAVSKDVDHGTFEQFAGRYLINRNHVTDSSHILLLGELGVSVAIAEIQYLINEFSNYEKQTIASFSIEKILDVVYEIKSKGYNPNLVFIPIEYYFQIFEWNKTNKPVGSKGSSFDTLYLDAETSLQVKYSNKKIELEDVIITSKEVNNWNYRPGEESEDRFTAKFDWGIEDKENTVVLVKTVFKFTINEKDGNAVLKINDFKKRDV